MKQPREDAGTRKELALYRMMTAKMILVLMLLAVLLWF